MRSTSPGVVPSASGVPLWAVNGLTGLRGVAGLVVAVLLVGFGANRAAFWVFLYAILTDLVDGRLAKMAGVPNPVGVWLDPLADKVLTDATWIALWWTGWAPTWLVVATIGRDLLAGWLWHRGVRAVVPAAQVAIAFEGVALCLLLFHGPWLGVHWPSAGRVLALISLALFAASLPRYWKVSRMPGPSV